MPFDLGPGTWAALAVTLLGAAYVRGYSGFGFSAIFIACAALLTNPVPLIPVVFTCEIIMTAFQARGIRGHIDWSRVGWLVAGATIALPVSITVILSVGEDTARLLVSGIVFVMSLILLSGWTITRKIPRPGYAGVGVISGLCNGAGIGGLPVAAFLAAQPIPAATFRATMIVYLTVLDMLTLPLMWWGGLITRDTAIGVALALPFLACGLWLGGRQFHAATPSEFRRLAILLLLSLSGLGLFRALF